MALSATFFLMETSSGSSPSLYIYIFTQPRWSLYDTGFRADPRSQLKARHRPKGTSSGAIHVIYRSSNPANEFIGSSDEGPARVGYKSLTIMMMIMMLLFKTTQTVYIYECYKTPSNLFSIILITLVPTDTVSSPHRGRSPQKIHLA